MTRRLTDHLVKVMGTAAGVALIVGVFGMAAVGAQQKPGAINTTPIDGLVSKLDQILSLLSPPAPGPVRLSTDSVLLGFTQGLRCYATNVGTTPLSVEVNALDHLGKPVWDNGPFVFSELPAGATAGVYGGEGGLKRCEFSFAGLPQQVRASATILTGTELVASIIAR